MEEANNIHPELIRELARLRKKVYDYEDLYASKFKLQKKIANLEKKVEESNRSIEKLNNVLEILSKRKEEYYQRITITKES